MSGTPADRDIAALARGGRTNFYGFLLRLVARIPFLFIAGRLYGAAALGRFASAMVVVELAGQLCTLGQKRGLALRLAGEERREANIIADGVVLSSMLAIIMAAALLIYPWPMFPSAIFTPYDRLLPLAILPATITDIALAALAYRFDIGATVRARSVVEPWVLSILAGVFYFIQRDSGLSLAYIGSILASTVVALVPLFKSYGVPRGWHPHPLRLARLALSTMPLAVADAVEWGTRKLDIAILGLFATPTSVGVYYVAQQVASLPQKLKTSFEPILGPVITRNLKDKNYPAIAYQVRQVGFWIIAEQAGIALALGIPGMSVLGLVGPDFIHGDLALQFLLAAEVCAATAVVSEAALIYITPFRNLAVSLITITLQAVLTLIGMVVASTYDFNRFDWASSAAGALMVTLAIGSLIKSQLLAHYLRESVNSWRLVLLKAALPAMAYGWVVSVYMPAWAELAFGTFGILGIYCGFMWFFGFTPADRVLFRSKADAS